MAYTTINKSTDYFNTKLYTGTTNAQSITGVGFQPDLTWVKVRSASAYHILQDAVRTATGTDSYQMINAAAASDVSDAITSFDSNGFSLGTDSNDRSNYNGQTHVAWNWKAGGGQGSSNTDGSINTTYTSVNTTAGFSISTYTGTGANATIGHGLGVAPKMIIFKELNDTTNFRVYHSAMGNGKVAYLNTNSAEVTDSTAFNNTSPTSSVFYVGTSGGTNRSGSPYVAYCFAEKIGYSKIGSISGNGNNDGTFCFTGFAPSFVLYKKINGTGDWYLVDNKRPGYNNNNKRLYSNTNQAEEQYDLINLYSNGFKLTNTTHAYTNDNAGTYSYIAIGQSLVGSNNVPCTAR